MGRRYMALEGRYIVPIDAKIKVINQSVPPRGVGKFAFYEWRRTYIEFFPDGRFFTAQCPTPITDEPVLQLRHWEVQSKEFPNNCGWYQPQRETILLEFLAGWKARVSRSIASDRNKIG